MSRIGRLVKLEADTLQRWRAAWEQSAVLFDKHTSGITVSPSDLLQKLKLERPGLSNDEVEREGAAFLESLGVTQYPEFWTWFNSWKLPEDDPPDLSIWPSDMPVPPDELPGQWDRAAHHMASEDVVEQTAAFVMCYLLATSRAVREYISTYA